MRSLTHVQLQGNQLSGLVPSNLFGFPQVEVRLHHNPHLQVCLPGQADRQYSQAHSDLHVTDYNLQVVAFSQGLYSLVLDANFAKNELVKVCNQSQDVSQQQMPQHNLSSLQHTRQDL